MPSSTWFPWARFNLKRNPFGELTREERIAAAVVPADRWVDWLAPGSRTTVQRRALQIMGDCGRGKTTHLLALADRLQGAAYVYLPEGGPAPPVPMAAIVLIDEAQRLPRRVRKHVLARGRPLVLGTHRDLTRPLRRARFEVQTALAASATDAEQICTVMNRRIELARLASGEAPMLAPADGAALARRFGDDLRAIEGYLYERFQHALGDEDGKLQIVG